MTDVTYLQMFLVIGLPSIFTSVSYSIFITYLILKKFSDFGDSSCKLDEYAPKGLGYTRMVDNVPPIMAWIRTAPESTAFLKFFLRT